MNSQSFNLKFKLKEAINGKECFLSGGLFPHLLALDADAVTPSSNTKRRSRSQNKQNFTDIKISNAKTFRIKHVNREIGIDMNLKGLFTLFSIVQISYFG